MGARTTAREAALMLVYAADADVSGALDELLPHRFWTGMVDDASISPDLESRTYAESIARGVLAKRDDLDALIKGSSQNWRLERMSKVDRSILRMCVWELESGVPRAIAIDEAIELAKRYGTEESGRFINGILEAIATKLNVK